MANSFQLASPAKFSWYFLAGNVIGLGLSMVSSMQNRSYVANQQKFQCSPFTFPLQSTLLLQLLYWCGRIS